MSAPAPIAGGVSPWSLALGAMLSVQLGSALSVPLIDTVGPAGTAWLRLTAGALVFLAIARPPLRSVRRADLPAVLGLGVTSALVPSSSWPRSSAFRWAPRSPSSSSAR